MRIENQDAGAGNQDKQINFSRFAAKPRPKRSNSLSFRQFVHLIHIFLHSWFLTLGSSVSLVSYVIVFPDTVHKLPATATATPSWLLVLPIANCPLSTAHCPLPIAHCQLPTANCQLPAANCLLPTAYCQLPTANCTTGSVRRRQHV